MRITNKIVKNHHQIKKIAKRIEEKYKPEKIILFGSYAWGKPTRDSDADLFIIKKTQERKIKRIQRVFSFLRDKDILLDVLVYTPKEVEMRLKIGDFFIEDIIKNGKLIYEKQ